MTHIIPVILSGGQGTRLWPLSRQTLPKQFIPLIGNRSLFEQTLARLADPSLFSPSIILCAKDHRFLVKNIIGENASVQKIIAEPYGRNTAPALCVASLFLKNQKPSDDPLLLLLPSDHYIPDIAAFHADVRKALPIALSGKIVTFGIKPTKPHTGYGYIECGKIEGICFHVQKFHEKPNEILAKSYIEKGNCYWNSGMFLMKSSVYLEELQRLQPEIIKGVKKALEHSVDDLGDVILQEHFSNVPNIAIDVAVMERTDRACVVPASFAWDDVGSWDSLWDMAEHDPHGNALRGDVVAVNSSNSYLRTDGPLLCAVGIENVIAVVEQDAIFIGAREKSEQLKDAIEVMKSSHRKELIQGRRCFCSWGYYDILADEPNYKVTRICIEPHQFLSLQHEQGCNYVYTVVAGSVHVKKSEDSTAVSLNGTSFSHMDGHQFIENKHDDLLELIEVCRKDA